MKKNLLALAVFALLLGCTRPAPVTPATATPPVDKCPIHNVTFSMGIGKLPDGMTVSWITEMYDAMEKYPYVRHNTWDTMTVKYCTACEAEIDRILESERNSSQQAN